MVNGVWGILLMLLLRKENSTRREGESDLGISEKRKNTKSAGVCSRQRFVFLHGDEKKTIGYLLNND